MAQWWKLSHIYQWGLGSNPDPLCGLSLLLALLCPLLENKHFKIMIRFIQIWWTRITMWMAIVTSWIMIIIIIVIINIIDIITTVKTIITTINIIICAKLLKARLTLILNYCRQSIWVVMLSSPGLQLIKGGFRSWPSGPRALRFFLRNFVLLFQKILSKINRIYSDGKCPRHPFLNFLDPSLLIVLRTTRPWVSREKMSEPRGEVLKAMSCTHPHWSKELMSQITPWQNILCSYIASK